MGLPTPPLLSTLTWRQLSRYSVIHAFIHPSIHFRQFPVLKDRRFQLLFRIVVIIISFVLMSIPTIFMSVTCTRTKLSCVYVTQWSCMFSAELLAPCMRSCFGCQNMMHIPCLGVTCSMLADCCMSTHHATCCIKLDLHRCGFEMVSKTWSRISAGLYMLLPAAHALLCFAHICLHTTACTQLLA